jgi:hypothetical protein
MIPYDLDPSLHACEPASTTLDDGFSPPPPPLAAQDDDATDSPSDCVDPSLWAKSPF